MKNDNIIQAKQAVERYFNVSLESTSRKRTNVTARQFYYYWLRNNTKLSLKDIAGSLQYLRQDHSTVVHALAEFDAHHETEKMYRNMWSEVKFQIDKATGKVIDEENLVLNAS